MRNYCFTMDVTPRPDRFYTSFAGYRAMMAWYDSVLSRLRVPFKSRCVLTRAGETHLLDAGPRDGLPLLLVHGISVSALNWRYQIENLAGAFRVIAPDVPGFSGRSAAVRLPYSGRHYADWLRDVMDALNIDRALLAGSSGGGAYVLELASVYPERAAGLVLINPCGLSRYPYPADFFRNRRVVDALGWIGRRFASMNTARRLVRASASPGVPLDETTVEMAYLLLKHFRRYPPPGPLTAGQLEAIRAPVLLMLSEHEPYFRPSMVIDRAQRHLRDLQTILVPDAGHDIHNDQAAVVSAAIRDFTAHLTGLAMPLSYAGTAYNPASINAHQAGHSLMPSK